MNDYRIFNYTYRTYILIIIIFLTSCSQNEKNSTKTESGTSPRNKEIFETSVLLKHYIKNELQKNSISLSDTPSLYWNITSVNEALKYIPGVKINTNDLYNQLQENKTLWSKENVILTKIISEKDLPGIRSKSGLTWTDFKKKSPDGYYVISHPLFLKNFEYAMIWAFYLCDERCGYGELRLYRKTSKGWTLIKTFGHLVA